MPAQLYKLLKKFLSKNDVPIHQEELKLQLTSHPSYPSLHSVTGVLDHFSIPNVGVKLPNNSETLKALPSCFLAVIISEGGKEIIIVEKRNKQLKTINSNNETKTWEENTFLEKWTGIIVAIEKDEKTSESHKTWRTKHSNFIFAMLSGVVVVAFIYFSNSLFSISHFILSILGVATSIFVVKHELGIQSSTASSICNLSEKTNCEAILNSKGATLFGLFKLSDVSIVIFSGYSLSWILLRLNGIEAEGIFYCCTILAIPFVAYSIYYQAVVVKKWCPLCLGIVAIIILQFSSLFLIENWTELFSISTTSLGLFLLGLLIPIIIWSYLKPLLVKKYLLEKLQITYYQFKRKYSLFKAVLNTQKRLTSSYPIPSEIVLGKKDAAIELILVTNPFCHYCKQAHTDMEKLLNAENNNLRIRIRFNIDSNDQASDIYKIVSRLLYLYNTQGQSACLKALNVLYKDGTDLKKWAANAAIPYSSQFDEVLESQRTWCTVNEINFTPALYLNGISYPKEYERSDLLLFMEELIEETNVQPTTYLLNKRDAS